MFTRNPGAAKFDWPGIQGVGGNARPLFCALSGVTVSLILSALDDAGNLRNWNGAGDFLTPAEADGVLSAVATARLELMIPLLIGVPVPFIGSVEPDWGLLCDGRTMQKADYPELWELTDPSERDATTFNLPDLRGLTIVGAGTAAGSGTNYPHLSSGGVESVTLNLDQIPYHTHTYTQPIPNVDLETPGVPDLIAAGINPFPQQTGGAGGGQPHENRQPYKALNYVIITPKP